MGAHEPNYPQQDVRTLDLKSKPISELLGLEPPAGIGAPVAFKVLKKIQEYVIDDEIDAGTAVIEEHYIDRDFMEDFSVFYSRSLFPYPNYCRRIHFFRGSPDDVDQEIRRLIEMGSTVLGDEARERDYREACRDFSTQRYCGFSVIKPLPGTPVGRTVLRTFPNRPKLSDDLGSTEPTKTRLFRSVKEYKVHLLGLELRVQGLAFQQQDVGVSACATTAIWVALQKTREGEEIGPTTPAHITTKASQSRLPFGRSMPAEGLSIDQMSLAIDSFGVSPVLMKVDSYRTARVALFSAAQSGLAPVLVISKSDGGKDKHHAVAVVGMKTLDSTSWLAPDTVSQDADRLDAIYIHDDRNGPYQLGLLKQDDPVTLRIRTMKGARPGGQKDDVFDEWKVTHILTPMHAKVRISIAELYRLGNVFATAIGASWMSVSLGTAVPTRMGLWVTRSHYYLEQLLLNGDMFPASLSESLARKVPLARYLGVIRVTLKDVATFDMLVDTTSTFRNPSYLALLSSSADERAVAVAKAVSRSFGCGMHVP